MGEKVDGRVEWFMTRMVALQGIRAEKLDKFKAAFLADEVSVRNLGRFFDESDVPFCYVYPDGVTISCNCGELPTVAQLKKKIVGLHRVRKEAEITKENIHETVVVVEMSKNVLELLNVYCHSVYLSTLMNPSNQRGWSDLISKDLMDKYHVFLAKLHVTNGLMKGATSLPLPPRDALPSGSAAQAGNIASTTAAKDRVHVLEGAVITWTKQIRHVLKQDPEMLLKEGRQPQPNAEIQFWKSKAANLNSIHSQLGMDGLKKVLKNLETNKSTYTNPFSRLQKEVEEAREEANDNCRFLAALQKGITALMSEGQSGDFEVLDKLYEGILHTILLIWKYSKYYNTPTRLAVLIREICNTVIYKAMQYISGQEVFNMIASEEAQDCYDKLSKTLSVCTAFGDTYNLFKEFAQNEGPEGWKMKNDALFARLGAFRERCGDALDFTKTVMQYNKCERVEIGGTKGKLLSECVVAIHAEFVIVFEEFKSVNYDIMDVAQKQFDADYFKFRTAVKDLDRRLGSLFSAAFDDQDTMQLRLKLFDNFEGLLDRAIIHAELDKKQKTLLHQYQKDLKDVETSFLQHKDKVDECHDDSPIYQNLPPVAGAIYWVRSYRQRICEPMSKIVFYNRSLKEVPEEFKEVDKHYKSLLLTFEQYEKTRYESWDKSSVDVAKDKLKMRLLRRQEKTGLLKVNFDPALVRLLREVRFFLIFDIDVPEAADVMFAKSKRYRSWVNSLDHIVQMYNSVLTELLPVEEPLLDDRITKMDTVLSPGLTELKWSSEDLIPDFIEATMKVVSDVAGVVDVMKGNLRNISAVLASWCKEPLIERRKGQKPMGMEEFDLKHKERVGMRMMSMTEGGKEIHKFVKDSSEALKVSKIASTWKSYVDFVNNIVIEGFVSSIAVSLQALCEILDPLIIAKNEMQPLFDVKIELRGVDVVFDPPFRDADKPHSPSLRKTIDDWLKDFFATVTCMLRLDMNAGDYLNEIKEHFQMQCLFALVSELVDATEAKCMEYRETFMQHSFLWTQSIDKSFEKFLCQDARDLVEDFEEEGMGFRFIMDRIKVDIGRPMPPLASFDKKIEYFSNMKLEMSKLKQQEEIHWLRIHTQPAKLAMVTFAREWEEKYTDFLKESTEKRIFSVYNFIQNVKKGLGDKSPVDDPGNSKLLYATMTHIRDVKLARNAVDKLFQPVRDLCQLLKKHHKTHDGLTELEQAPSVWAEVYRMALDMKESILPMRNEEMLKIRNKIDVFAEEVAAFRSQFLEKCPFDPSNAVAENFDQSYDTLNEYYEKTMAIKTRSEEFNELEMLFDMQMSNYRALKECVEDLVSLKNVWDGVVLVRETFNSWNDILWDKIDTEALVLTVKDLQNQVKNMPKQVRGWKLYKWLMEEVKNMVTVLPLVNDLHGETMRDRHWTNLMTVTQKSFDKGPDFCFSDLLNLQLHEFSEEVSDIVDQSAKEAKIEKKTQLNQ
jgi:dynein heavy chain